MSHQTNNEINEDLLSNESLGTAQEKNLAFLDTVLSEPKISGIPVLKAFTYEFVQILNNMYLQDILPEETEQQESEKEEV